LVEYIYKVNGIKPKYGIAYDKLFQLSTPIFFK
jgi:hypothetical protein